MKLILCYLQRILITNFNKMKILFIVGSILSAITIIYLVDKNKKLQDALDNALSHVVNIPNPPSNK